MSETSNFINAILTEASYDFTEEYEELLKDWYGDDISMFNPDDEDLLDVARCLTRHIEFWRTASDPKYPWTSYEKLRYKYEMLLRVHSNLLEAYSYLVDEKEQLVEDCRYFHRKIGPTIIKGGCGNVLERRLKNGDSDAA